MDTKYLENLIEDEVIKSNRFSFLTGKGLSVVQESILSMDILNDTTFKGLVAASASEKELREFIKNAVSAYRKNNL